MRCEEALSLLVDGEREAPGLCQHLSACSACARAERIVMLAETRGAPLVTPTPTLSRVRLDRLVVRRRHTRGALLLVAAVLLVLLVQRALRPGVPDPGTELDLLAALESVDAVLTATKAEHLPAADIIEILNPFAGEWIPPYQPLTDALGRQGDL